ncbi:MAG: HlyD family efflux transporter periplasmic adaptor subunit [Terrimicrobiaceae bacterium]|nr:HlyD family efflux transporter periplasmic adaptor subunit [Terrimicrobiaceae bacterium]
MERRTQPMPATIRRARRTGAGRKAIPWILGAALAALIVWGLLPKPIPVDVGTVTRGPLKVTVLEEGKTRIRHRYVLSSPIPAYLERVPLRAGDAIIKGVTVLATLAAAPASFLDPRARAQAVAAEQSAEAAIEQRGAQVGSVRAELDLALKELKRNEQLRRTGAIAQSQWDTAANHVDVLRRNLDSAEFALKVANFEREQARAALMQMESASPQAGKPVEIRAPVSGRVLNVFEESARMVNAGQQIIEVGDPGDIEADIEMLSTDAVNVKSGAEVSIEQWGGGYPLPGHVSLVEPGGYTKISALGVEEQRTLVRVEFDDLPAGVFGDRFRIEARVTTWAGGNVLQAPTGALFRRGNDWMTFALDRGRAKPVKVKIGHNNGVAAEVLDGLREGQRVILHPPDTLSAGSSVSVRPAE